LKKAQFLVVAILAALMVLTAFPVCFDYGKAQNDRSTLGSFIQTANSSPLPILSESIAPGSPSTSGDQTDNTTSPITSGGAVKASFTVVSPPISNDVESGTAPTGNGAGSPNHTAAATQPQETDGVAMSNQQMKNDQSGIVSEVRPESGGLTLSWLLLTAACSVWIAALSGLAFVHFRAKAQT
jgi:hypothetical protein